jgi:hypothetical protein
MLFMMTTLPSPYRWLWAQYGSWFLRAASRGASHVFRTRRPQSFSWFCRARLLFLRCMAPWEVNTPCVELKLKLSYETISESITVGFWYCPTDSDSQFKVISWIVWYTVTHKRQTSDFFLNEIVKVYPLTQWFSHDSLENNCIFVSIVYDTNSVDDKYIHTHTLTQTRVMPLIRVPHMRRCARLFTDRVWLHEAHAVIIKRCIVGRDIENKE